MYFYRHWQPVYDIFIERLTSKVIEFVEGNGVDVINSIVDKASSNVRTLLIFYDSCEEILQSMEFANLATSGRHKGLHVIFIKHNMYQQGKYSVTVDKNTTHIVIMKSTRIGKQLEILGREIDGASGSFMQDCYKKATSYRFGHLLVDLSPSCHELVRFCSNITGQSTKADDTDESSEDPHCTVFFVPESMATATTLKSLQNDKLTNDFYSSVLSSTLSEFQ